MSAGQSWLVSIVSPLRQVVQVPAIAMSTSGIYQGGGGGGSGQIGNITVPVAEGMVLTISLGAVSPPGNTVAYGTAVEINGIPIITCNGASGNTSRMDGGNGATLNTNVFCSYSCRGGGGMNGNGGGASWTGSTGSTSLFSGTASAEWGGSNSGNDGLNNGGALPLVEPTTGTQPSGSPGAGGGVLSGVFLSSNTSGHLQFATDWLSVYANDKWWPQIFHCIYTQS